jgi:sodium transport system ATP-binding protein
MPSTTSASNAARVKSLDFLERMAPARQPRFACSRPSFRRLRERRRFSATTSSTIRQACDGVWDFSASTALYPRLTARETIEFFARINKYPEDKVKARVDALIARFGISAYADVRVEKMSTGMKQKVSIARTVAHNPKIIIFDEPTVGLDVLNAIEVLDAILELKNEGRTVIFSTHIMSEAEKLCDRIAIIHNGKILACDTLEALRANTGQHYLEDIFVRYVKGPA